MKKQLRFFWIAASVIAALFFFACESLVNETTGTEAAITGLVIDNVRVSTSPPRAISGDEFDDPETDIVGADVAVAPLNSSSNTQNVRVNPRVSKGANVWWGLGSQDLRPFVFKDVREKATFDDGDYMYFKVTSEDGEITNYYRYAIWVRSPVIEVAELYIGDYITHQETSDTGNIITVVDVDERMMASFAKDDEGNNIGNPDLATAVASTKMGTLAIMTNQARNADIEVVPFDSNASIRYGVSPNYTATPSMGTGKRFNLVDQSYLYVQVTAENTVNTAIYKFRIEVGRIATIKTLTFTGDYDAKYEVANRGTQAGVWANVANGKFETADMPALGFGITIEKTDPASRVSYELITNKNAAAPAIFSSPNKLVFNGTNVLAIKVESDNVVAGKTGATRYYKIEVGLLACGFRKQPQSDYYYYCDLSTTVGDAPDTINWYDYVKLNTPKPDPDDSKFKNAHNGGSKGSAKPLTFELDREGTFTYQWYETNSWYGGYGFDADNRILYFPTGNPKEKAETGFTQTSYYRANFDEKKNVCLHNGGNEFYRLENPGRQIPGATGATYTPPIDRRPFLGGATSEAHYYWVEVTDTAGRKAVSKRATIVSERDPAKEHYIVNLNEDLYLGPKAKPTEVGYAKNQKVFKKQRETYKIPVTFLAEFDITKYSVATVQALFWLIDGTPWIQNWTQGDIGFEDEDGTRVMYYNLTNNNGTLGLVGGGKEPSGGTVNTKPKYLIVKPAGEKPVTEMPPLNADGTPIPNNQAQGWFCGFIELVEVRFESPAQ